MFYILNFIYIGQNVVKRIPTTKKGPTKKIRTFFDSRKFFENLFRKMSELLKNYGSRNSGGHYFTESLKNKYFSRYDLIFRREKTGFPSEGTIPNPTNHGNLCF